MPVSILKGKNLLVSVRVTNTGKKDGEEVIQLYVVNKNNSIKAPLKALKGFKRILLKTGESKVVSFQIKPSDLSIANDKAEFVQAAGKWTISVGGGQPGEPSQTTSNVVNRELTIK
jgi:beta-glucosidase